MLVAHLLPQRRNKCCLFSAADSTAKLAISIGGFRLSNIDVVGGGVVAPRESFVI